MSNMKGSLAGFVSDAISGLANMLGLGSLYEKTVKTLMYGDSNISNHKTIQNFLDQIARARNLDQNKIDEIERVLSNVPMLSNYNVKHIVADAKKNLNNQLRQAKIQSAQNQHNLNRAENLISDITSMSAGDLGKGKGSEYAEQARDLLQEVDNNLGGSLNAKNIETKI